MNNKFINCYEVNAKLGETDEPSCFDGTVSVKFIYKEADIDYSKREYQREEVADLDFKQEIMTTILQRTWCRVPEIHIRVITETCPETGKRYHRYELVDGQQRVTSITIYLDSGYPLPKGLVIYGRPVGGMYAEELKSTYYDLYTKILEYRISCKWYENLSDEQTAELFVSILNNTIDMKPQEIRNAISGPFSTWVRDTARGYKEYGVPPHKLFERITINNKKTLKYFGKFELKGRMEVEEWLSQLCYMYLNGWTEGVSQVSHTKWVRDIQRPGGVYESKFTDKTKLNDLLNFAYKIIKSVPKDYKIKLTPMLSHVLVLYAYALKVKHGKIIPAKFTKAFFKTYNDWSCQKKQLYINEININGKPMNQFSSLFGGRNVNAIGTICYVLDKELDANIDFFGVVELDQRKSFPDDEIYKRWKEQGMTDGYTDLPLELEDAVGDHKIPRSEGVKLGGVTEYHNLVVTSAVINNIKSNMNPESFKKQIE